MNLNNSIILPGLHYHIMRLNWKLNSVHRADIEEPLVSLVCVNIS